MIRAIVDGDSGELRELLIQGGDPESLDELGRSPLHLAVEHGDVEIVRLLLEAGANPDAEDKSGWTPLYRSVEVEADVAQQLNRPVSTAVLGVLVEFGADVNRAVSMPALNRSARTPLGYALEVGNGPAANLLRQAGARP
jgi:ankyrin repeat protein